MDGKRVRVFHLMAKAAVAAFEAVTKAAEA